MPRKCAVRTCSSRYYSQDLSFHRFPKSQNLRKIWAVRCQVNDQFDRSFRICSQHFTKSDFEKDLILNNKLTSRQRYQRRRLICGAVPSINLPPNLENGDNNLEKDQLNLNCKHAEHRERRNDEENLNNLGGNISGAFNGVPKSSKTFNTAVVKKEPIFVSEEAEMRNERRFERGNESSDQFTDSENEGEFVIDIRKSRPVPEKSNNNEINAKRKERSHLMSGNERVMETSVCEASRSLAGQRQDSKDQEMELRISNVRSLSSVHENERAWVPRVVEVADRNQLMVIDPKKYFEIFTEFREILQSKDEKVSFLEEKIRILEDRNFLLEKQLTGFSKKFHKKIPNFA